MSQHDMVIANQSFPAFRADANAALQALASNSKGSSRPSTVYAGQWWIDDTTPSSTVWTIYIYDGTHDVGIGLIDSTTGTFIPTVNPHADTVGGTANAITLDIVGGLLNPPAYYEGLFLDFIAGSDNTGATTVDVGGLGAKTLAKRGSTALSAGDIRSGMVCYIEYDGTRFQLINPATVTGYAALAGATFTGTVAMSGAAINEAAEVTVASATSTAIGAAASNNVIISGTTTITSFDNVAAGITRKVRFTGALTLTHNATSLILPGAANITTANGDELVATSLGSGNWKVRSYNLASGQALVTAGSVIQSTPVALSGTSFTPTVDFTTYCEYDLSIDISSLNTFMTFEASSNGGSGYGTTTYAKKKLASTTFASSTADFFNATSSNAVVRMRISQPSVGGAVYFESQGYDISSNNYMPAAGSVNLSAACNKIRVTVDTSWAGYYTLTPRTKR